MKKASLTWSRRKLGVFLNFDRRKKLKLVMTAIEELDHLDDSLRRKTKIYDKRSFRTARVAYTYLYHTATRRESHKKFFCLIKILFILFPMLSGLLLLFLKLIY